MFGGAEDFDKRLTGMVRGIKDVENTEEVFEAVLKMLEKDNKIDINILRNSPEFKDFVIGTAEGSGYVLKTATSLNAVEDALNKNFKYIRRDILNELSGAKTNLDAFVKLDNYFRTQGLTLNEMLKRLDVMIKDADVDSAMYQAQKEFLENLMDELGLSREMLAKDTEGIKRALEAVTGSEKIIKDTNGARKIVRIPYENTDEMLVGVLKEIDAYKVRGNQMIEEAEHLFKLQKGFYNILNTDGRYASIFYKMLGDTTITDAERITLEQIIKAIEGDSPMNDLFNLMNSIKRTPLQRTNIYDTLVEMHKSIQEQTDYAVSVLDLLEPKYANVLSDYKFSPEQIAVHKEIYDDYTPDGIYKRLKDLNLSMKGLGNEDLETAKYLQKLIDQPNMMKTFDNPIKPNELGKKLDLI